MADALQIRPARDGDLPGVLKLYAQPEIDDGDVLPLAAAARLHARFASYPDYTLYIVEQDAIIVGSFALLVMDNLGHLGAPSAIVEDVVVDPALMQADQLHPNVQAQPLLLDNVWPQLLPLLKKP